MVQPINYMANYPALDLTRQFEGLGNSLAQLGAQRQATKQNEAYKRDLQAAFDDPTPKNWAMLSAKYPQQREAFAQSWDILEDERKDSEFYSGAEVYNALTNNKPEVALGLLDERIEAERNSGEDVESLENIRSAIEANPNQAAKYLAFSLSTLDPQRWGKIAEEGRLSEMAPSNLTKAQADARKAAVAADFAESEAVMGLEKAGWDIYKLQEDVDIARENNRIAALNAQIKRETNELKKEEMTAKLAEMKRKREEELRTKAAELKATEASIDNSLNTIDRLLSNPELDNVLGSVEGSKFYPSTLVALLSPGADADKRADVLADIETVQSQSFLNNLMTAKERGATFGNLTQQEGEKLENYITSLKTKQSEPQFRANMLEIQRLLMKSRNNLAEKYGIPSSVPDTPNVESEGDEIDALVNKYLSEEG